MMRAVNDGKPSIARQIGDAKTLLESSLNIMNVKDYPDKEKLELLVGRVEKAIAKLAEAESAVRQKLNTIYNSF